MTGSEFTEADVKLFVTLIRFDCVYVTHFKCNRKRIVGKLIHYLLVLPLTIL